MLTRCAPTRAQASATFRVPSAFTRNARSGSDSHTSTAVHAAQCTTTSGRVAVMPCITASRSATSSVAWSASMSRVMPGGVEARRDLVSDLAARAGDEDPHGRAFSGSHHQRFARYHSTVSASASSRVRCFFQPERGDLARCRRSSAGRGRGGRVRTRRATRRSRAARAACRRARGSASRCPRRCCRSRPVHRAASARCTPAQWSSTWIQSRSLSPSP